MIKADLRNSNFVIKENKNIRSAMEKITDNQRGCVAVVDDGFFLQGIVSDGDIRRAMLRGATVHTPITKIVNISSAVVYNEDLPNEQAEEIFQKESSIKILPVVDKSNKLIDIIVRDPQKRREL